MSFKAKAPAIFRGAFCFSPVIPGRDEVASPESITPAQRLWIPGPSRSLSSGRATSRGPVGSVPE
jgi:hypothetical protein